MTSPLIVSVGLIGSLAITALFSWLASEERNGASSVAYWLVAGCFSLLAAFCAVRFVKWAWYW